MMYLLLDGVILKQNCGGASCRRWSHHPYKIMLVKKPTTCVVNVNIRLWFHVYIYIICIYNVYRYMNNT